MFYSYDKEKKLFLEPKEYNKNTNKELLQFAVGGLMYSPATNKKIADDIISCRRKDLHSICLCLEDAIGDDMVEQAEKCLKSTLSEIVSAINRGNVSINDIPLIFIRVREPKQIKKLFTLFGKELFSIVSGFSLPKFDKTNCVAYLDNFNDINSQLNNSLYIMPIIESKNVMYKQRRIDQLIYLNNQLFKISDNVLNIRVGATDFCSTFGIRRNINNTIYDMRVIADCLADIVNVFCKNYVISGPVWEYFDSNSVPGAWSEGLKKELQMDKLNGFIGKTCIHPSQLKYINESNIVSYEQYKDALSVLGMADGIVGVSKGFNNNKMNEVKTHTTWARKIMGLSYIYGVAEN